MGAAGLLLLATLAVMPALAQEQNQNDQSRPHKERHQGPVTVASGVGAAVEVDEDGIYRSHLRLGMVKDNNTGDIVVKRGALDIAYRNTGQKYEVVQDTWTVKIGDVFTAEGKVQDRKGEQYSVALSGRLLDSTERGKLYFVEGRLSGDGEDDAYKLYYMLMVHDKTVDDKPRHDKRPDRIARE